MTKSLSALSYSLAVTIRLDKIIPRFLLRDPVLLEHDDYIKVSGVYHGTGYGEPGEVLESVNWLEFIRIERWDRENKCWQTADSW
jgi:hypothetical protein